MILPANTSAAHLHNDLAGLQSLATLNILDFGGCLRNPQVVLGIGVHANVGLGDGRGRRHGGIETKEGNEKRESSERESLRFNT